MILTSAIRTCADTGAQANDLLVRTGETAIITSLVESDSIQVLTSYLTFTLIAADRFSLLRIATKLVTIS